MKKAILIGTLLLSIFLIGCDEEEQSVIATDESCKPLIVGYENEPYIIFEGKLRPYEYDYYGPEVTDVKNMTIELISSGNMIQCYKEECYPLEKNMSKEICDLKLGLCFIEENKSIAMKNIIINQNSFEIENRNNFEVTIRVKGYYPIIEWIDIECKQSNKTEDCWC